MLLAAIAITSHICVQCRLGSARAIRRDTIGFDHSAALRAASGLKWTTLDYICCFEALRVEGGFFAHSNAHAVARSDPEPDIDSKFVLLCH